MPKHLMVIIAGIVLLLLVILVLIAQFSPGEARTLRGVDLEDMTYQEVEFPNPTQGINLAGMLFLPEGDGPFPAVVVIHGSGTSHRNNTWYLTFTRYLQDHGIAVLLPDKRGSESSEGNWRTASFEDLATDTLSAISYLQAQHPQTIYIRNIAQKEFWDAVGNFDPIRYWQDVNVPSLVLYGQLDTNVPSQTSADRLAALGNPNVEVAIFEGSGHPLEDPEWMGDSYFRQDALELIRDFIVEATLAP
ncbi:alpha/beta hydrolase [Acidobacteria bacterium AH-259-L09]|nr:alpha/beta hydrolase [Acidobacteria bacterium AH-259-L09]